MNEGFTRKKINNEHILDPGRMQGDKFILGVKIHFLRKENLYLVQASYRSKSQGKQLYLK